MKILAFRILLARAYLFSKGYRDANVGHILICLTLKEVKKAVLRGSHGGRCLGIMDLISKCLLAHPAADPQLC